MLLEKLLEEHLLPVGPDIRTDTLDISIGEKVEHSEVFTAPHLPGKIDDHPLIVQIPSLGNMGKEKVLAHQKLQPLPVFFRKPHAAANGTTVDSPFFGMPPPVAFANIVQKDCQQQ